MIGAFLCLVVTQGVRPQGVRAQIAPASGTVGGQVQAIGTGRALMGATVVLSATSRTLGAGELGTTDATGSFRFAGLVPGTYRLTVTLPGYDTASDTLHVPPGSELDFIVAMSPTPLELDPMIVEVEARPMGPLIDFERRRLAHRGTFFTREEIEASNVTEITDLLRTVPGARLVAAGAFRTRLVFRGGCRPDLWLDGAHVGTTADIDSFIEPHAVEAVEVYRGPDLPGEFGTNLCGAVVVWTRRGHSTSEEKSLRTQLLFAGSLVAAFLLIRR